MTDQKKTGKKKGFWAALMDRLDEKLKAKSRKQGSCCCGKSNGGSSCC